MAPSPSSGTRRLPRRAALPGVDSAALTRGRIATATQPTPPGVASWIVTGAAAISGTILALFVIIHAIGNLKIYAGAEHFNDYAHWLRVAGEPLLPAMGLLWIARITLLTAAVVHIWSTVTIYLRGRRVRGGSRAARLRAGSWLSRAMLPTGIALLAFIILHLLDLTIGTINPDFHEPSATSSSAYENTIASFSSPLFASLYLLGMAALLIHLSHGLWVLTTGCGVTGKRTRKVWRILAYLLGIGVPLANISVVLAVLLGVVS